MRQKSLLSFQVISIMICFYVMGAIEMVGIASNYIKEYLNLNDMQANLLPSLVYICFFLCTIPAGILIKWIGKCSTVVVSLAIMLGSMIIPLFLTSYIAMLITFTLLGIGSVSLQTSLYPLLESKIAGISLVRHLTTGQFIKTFSSFSAPYVAMIGALYLSHIYGLGWRILFLFYLIVILFTLILMLFGNKSEEKHNEQVFTFRQCLDLTRNPLILLSVIGVMCHVGIDICTNTLAPKLLINRAGVSLEFASFGSSAYFIARLTGCAFYFLFISRVSKRFFFISNIILILLGVVGLFWAKSLGLLYICIAVIGLGNANLFPILYSEAILGNPRQKAEMSVLMIMSQCGGALFTFTMGICTDWLGLNGAVGVLLIGVLYLILYSFKLGKQQHGIIS